jgi:hypothetical protein
MPMNGRTRIPRRALSFVAALCLVAFAGIAGCTEGIRAGNHDAGTGTGMAGATGTMGLSGGALSQGGLSSGGTRTGGAMGSASGESCANLKYDYCVDDCLKDRALTDSALCTNGSWSCPRGYVLTSSCPVLACAVAGGACCNLTTGLVTENACEKNGYRSACPQGSEQAAAWQPWCVPQSLERTPCRSLDEQPCTGPALACRETSRGYISCECVGLGADASAGTWHCNVYIGP